MLNRRKLKWVAVAAAGPALALAMSGCGTATNSVLAPSKNPTEMLAGANGSGLSVILKNTFPASSISIYKNITWYYDQAYKANSIYTCNISPLENWDSSPSLTPGQSYTFGSGSNPTACVASGTTARTLPTTNPYNGPYSIQHSGSDVIVRQTYETSSYAGGYTIFDSMTLSVGQTWKPNDKWGITFTRNPDSGSSAVVTVSYPPPATPTPTST